MFCLVFLLLLVIFSDVTFAAKGYFDALVRMGELASESQGSKDLGKWQSDEYDIDICFLKAVSVLVFNWLWLL